MFYSRNYTAVVCTDGTKRQQVSQHSSEKAIDLSFSNLRSKKVKWNAKKVLKSIICDFQKCRTIWRTNLSLSTKVITTHKRKSFNQKFSLKLSFKGRLILKWNLYFPPIFMTKNNEKTCTYSQVPIKRVGPNKRVGWIFIKYFCLSLCLFLSSCFLGVK